jgi:O-antigen ligase
MRAPHGLPVRRVLEALGFLLALFFLLTNLAARGHALHAAGARAGDAFVLGVVLAAALVLLRPSLLAPALTLFGASFFLYGFHSYRLPNQAFELLVTALALVLLLRRARRDGALPAGGGGLVLPLFAAYALVATLSLLLLPPVVVEHRLFLEGGGFARAILDAFPKDPLYPIASVNRLWLFLLFASVLSSQPDARTLFRGLFRGIAGAALVAVVLGLLDFLGVFSLARYNLSHLFYGAQYRRLQSTFGNPSWFACFVSLALPFVLLELWEAQRLRRVAIACLFPLCAASLFLSGARASWLAGLVVIVSLAGLGLLSRRRRRRRPLPSPGSVVWLALGSAVATFAVLLATALLTAGSPTRDKGSPGRLEGLSREVRIRGLGLTSPRPVAARYAIELAKQKPLLGLGYESFNMHLRAQLDIPSSAVASVVNTAVAHDASEFLFDDSHNTALQVLAGTGAVGLGLWLALAAAGLVAVARALRRDGEPECLAVLLGLVLFHFYGLFQGMAYIPVLFFLFPALNGYATTLDPGPLPPGARKAPRVSLLALGALVLVSAVGYAGDRGYASLKRRFSVPAYLPDEAAEFEGFYRPETGPSGEFRWMSRRGIVNVARATPFRLSITCDHPDAAGDPVVLSLTFEGRDAGAVVFRRPGTVERRFDLGAPGALRLSVSRTFRPGGEADRRELGVSVSAIRWE